MLLELFKNLALVVGCLFLLLIIYSIISIPFQKLFRRKKTEKLIEKLNEITKEAIEELKKAEEAKKTEEKSKKQPKKTTKKTTKTEGNKNSLFYYI